MRLEWLPILAVDQGLVDEQHRHLFELYNGILVLPENEIDRTVVLAGLLDYARYHFAEEEALMQTNGYPEDLVRRHKSLHATFFRELEKLAGAPLYQVLDYFQEWLLRHIMTEDRKIGTFLKSLASDTTKL